MQLNVEASVVGVPVPGLIGIEAYTTEQDWVVEGMNAGKSFRLYVSPHVSRDEAIRAVASTMQFRPDTLEWVKASRRNEVERCIRIDNDWLRSRTL